MPSPSSHGTDQKRHYSGESESANLVSWLNEGSTDTRHRGVRQVLDTYREFREELEGSRLLRDGKTEEGKAALTKLGCSGTDCTLAVERLQRLLYRYKYYPMLFPFDFMPCHWFPAMGRRNESQGWPPGYNDVHAVFDIAHLAEMNLLDRLKKCGCGNWMFARFSHQRFCSIRCREKEFRSSFEWKEYRRKKAREYYKLHKIKNVK
jgi:hypothetical protein